MARLLVRSFTISLDGYGAGPRQSVENPLGVGGEELHDWLVHTRTFKRMQRRDDGDTHFVTEGIHAALERAQAAAGHQDIRLLGGAATIRQYLQAGLVDEMHLAVSPLLLGSGEHLLAGLDLPALGYQRTQSVPSAKAVHYVIGRT